MIKCLLTELGRAGQGNIWHSVTAHNLYIELILFTMHNRQRGRRTKKKKNIHTQERN